MAKQKGTVKLSGTLGGISFYKANDDFLAREKGGPTREEVLHKKGFERTRENSTEFGHCSRAGKLLRTALALPAHSAVYASVPNRLTERLVRVLHSDTVSPRGQRRLQHGQLSMLEGFELLQEARLADSLLVRYAVAPDRAAGTCTVSLPSFMPKACIEVPPHATRVRLVATALAVDFDQNCFQQATAASEPLRLDDRYTEPLTLTCSFEESNALPWIVVLGLQFMEEYEGFCYPLREKQYNAMAIVWAESGRGN